MTLTELRDTFTSVSDAVSVPVPDVATFERRVAGVRRRRTAARVSGVVAAVAVVASGSTVALSVGDGHVPDRTGAAHVAPAGPHSVPVLVDGHLRIVDDHGVMGGAGPAAASIVGVTPHGVVVLTEDGTLGRVEESGTGQLQQLVPGKVGVAYLDGDAVVYERDVLGQIRWRGIEPTVASSDSAQTEEGQLSAATLNRVVVIGGPDGALVSYDADGSHPLALDDFKEIDGVETGGDVVAVRTEDRVVFFSADGVDSTAYAGVRAGALAPDGHTYAQQTLSREAVELLDPTTLDVTPVEGPAGPVNDVGWAPDGDLLVVVQQDSARTLWRCLPSGTGCAAQVVDPTATLQLPGPQL
jgi:hypothetical protein